MAKLMDKYYDAVVISDEVDPNHGGAVRVKIIGVTDSLKPEEQPFVIPSVSSMQAVPTKGATLRVEFDEGDIQKGKYTHVSAEGRYLPEELVSDYPNVAVTNLGGDFFFMTHNRRTKESVVSHPSNSTVSWTRSGSLIHDSDKGYTNAGYGAINNQGTKIQSVLTEGTVDVFCCTPVGNNVSNGGAFQGSEYMFVTHISKATVDLINGQSSDDFELTEDKDPSKEVGGAELETKPIYDADGNTVTEIPFYPIESYVEVTDKEVSRIIITKSDSNDFLESASKISDNGNDFAVHYLIGRIAGDPPIDGERSATDQDKSKGLVQFVEIKNDVHYASEANILEGTETKQANEGAVVIMLVGTGDSYTEYQYEQLNNLIAHIRFVEQDADIPYYVPDQLLALPPLDSIGALNPEKVGS